MAVTMSAAAKNAHVELALEKLGHEPMARAVRSLESDLADFGYEVTATLTVKQDTLKLALSIKPQSDDDDDDQPRLHTDL